MRPLYDRSPASRLPANANGGHHPHTRGKVAVGHVGGSASLTRRPPVVFEWLEPAGYIDVHCPCCLSTVTGLAGAPACVAAAVVVRHGDGCPRLAQMLEAGHR
jgi:hypothetical protein